MMSDTRHTNTLIVPSDNHGRTALQGWRHSAKHNQKVD